MLQYSARRKDLFQFICVRNIEGKDRVMVGHAVFSLQMDVQLPKNSELGFCRMILEHLGRQRA